MEEPLAFSELNDFIFCPASIYFHGMYEGVEGLLYKEIPQLKGTQAHKAIDEGTFYDDDTISGLMVYAAHYNLIGKIDRYKKSKRMLVESKRVIKQVFEGYVFQLYAQYFGMLDAGFSVDELRLYDMSKNKPYVVSKPKDDPNMFKKFEQLIAEIRSFDLAYFVPETIAKCQTCIYSNICSWSLYDQ